MARSSWKLLQGLVFAPALLSGCVSASLATNTGPTQPGKIWSEAKQQAICCGEEFATSFVLIQPRAIPVAATNSADYAVMRFLGTERLLEPDGDGRFTFWNAAPAAPCESARLEITAYRQMGRKDFARVGDQVLRRVAAEDPIDVAITKRSLIFRVYQPRIRVRLPVSADELNLDAAVLRLQRSDGLTSSVYRSHPGRRGWTWMHDEATGADHVEYEPTAGQISASGKTRIEFVTNDSLRRPLTIRDSVDTP